jgi:hypothetical protein
VGREPPGPARSHVSQGARGDKFGKPAAQLSA